MAPRSGRNPEESGILQSFEFTGEAQLPRRVCRLKPFEEQPAEQAREDVDREEEVWPTAEPLSIPRQRTAWNETMNVRMMGERLPPCMQNGKEPDLATEMVGIGRDGLDRRGDSAEQDRIDDCLVVEGDLGDFGGHREDDVEVGNRQKIRLSIGKPLLPRYALTFRAVPVTAGVIGDAGMCAVLAGFDMSPERRRAAKPDRRHDAALYTTHMAVIDRTISLTMEAKDIRHLQSRAHCPLSLAAPPPASDDQTGFACWRSSSRPRAYTGPWSRDWHAPTEPE